MYNKSLATRDRVEGGRKPARGPSALFIEISRIFRCKGIRFAKTRAASVDVDLYSLAMVIAKGR
jgi:hypothetical protein